MKKKIELLAPAKNFDYGKTAINFGADAVYIGAPKFNARAAASCSLDEIQKLYSYAKKFDVKVYVALNTIIFENELEEAEKLIWQIYQSGADALIIQDMGILEMNLPPIAIHASVQADSFEIERIKFFDKIGLERVILARELSLETIKKIKQETSIELEAFVHGSLCVGLSGRCYLSYYIGGRSSNRGECAQPCRLKYQALDENLAPIGKPKYYLSIKDLNRSDYLENLIDAGVVSFKIEGRLKDINYVKNVVAYYRNRLDKIIDKRNDLIKSSLGNCDFPFEPNLNKTFSRGYTDFFLVDSSSLLKANTSKSIGEEIGKVIKINKDFFELDNPKDLKSGDGICFFDANDELNGFYVENISGKKLYFPKNKSISIKIGTKVFRNYDKDFDSLINKIDNCRKIYINLIFEENEDGFVLIAETIDKNLTARVELKKDKVIAEKLNSRNLIINCLKKSGDSVFRAKNISINISRNYFFKFSELNELRRKAFEQIEQQIVNRRSNYKKIKKTFSIIEYYKKEINYSCNVANSLSEKFYSKRGVKKIQKSIEIISKKQISSEIPLMISKYCVYKNFDRCLLDKSNDTKEIEKEKLKLIKYLRLNDNIFKIETDCKNCLMKLIAEKNKNFILAIEF